MSTIFQMLKVTFFPFILSRIDIIFSSVNFANASGLVHSGLYFFNIFNFSARFWCCVHKHVFLLAKFARTKLLGLIRAKVKNEHGISMFSLINFS